MVRTIINVERYFEVLPANFVNIWMTWRLDSRTHRQFIVHFIFNNNASHRMKLLLSNNTSVTLLRVFIAT